ncbi:hypothetical protein GALL_511120 [mine drainage metagenome]|uniref:Uncharacterized protein n=1 Tax=mine drainage metagenome TaxID=410659 RepID=A0A1J5P7U6_9ZZZZ
MFCKRLDDVNSDTGWHRVVQIDDRGNILVTEKKQSDIAGRIGECAGKSQQIGQDTDKNRQ